MQFFLFIHFYNFRTFETCKKSLNSDQELIMNQRKKYQYLLVLMLIFWMLPGLNAQHKIPGNFCISSEELKLYNLVNNYRKLNKLSEIPLSKSLCYVAKVHVNDLQFNHPDTNDCNLHSWSQMGDWAECCYGREKINQTCMTSKPGELTNYPGKGYEIAFWESVDAQPDIVIDLWKSSASSNDMMLSKGIWKGTIWKSLGVGILKGYAVVWFGKEDDDEGGIKICSGDEMSGILDIKVDTAATIIDTTEIKTVETTTETVKKTESKPAQVKYYLIGASVPEESQAKSEVERFRKKGFKNPKILPAGKMYRISLGDYATKEEALSAKKRLGEKYNDVWIFKN